MELRHLRYFVAVAEALSFSRAAAQLHITQPALSRQIRDLETGLGCRLLHRGANARTELTPEGRRMLVGAKELLEAAGQLADEVRGQTTRIRLGHYGSLWLDYFSTALRQFAKKHPGVVLQPVELTPGTLPGALRRGEVEVALLGQLDQGLRREFQTRMVAAVSAQVVLPATHPLAKRRRLKLTELRTANWVSWDEAEFPGRKQLLLAACRREDFRPRIVQETDSIASMLVRVATSDVIGYSLPMAAQYPHPGVVFTDTDPWDAMVFAMNVGWRKNEPRAALIEDLVAQLAANT